MVVAVALAVAVSEKSPAAVWNQVMPVNGSHRGRLGIAVGVDHVDGAAVGKHGKCWAHYLMGHHTNQECGEHLSGL